MYNISFDMSEFSKDNFLNGLLVADKLGINNIEISSIFEGVCVSELSGNQTEDYRNMLIDMNKRIVLMNMQIDINNLAEYKRAFRAAHLLNVKNVKIYLPVIDTAEAVRNLSEIAKMGERYNIRVLFENSHETFFTDDGSMTKFADNFKGTNIGFIYNPMEFVKNQNHPFFHIFYNSKLKGDIVFLRLNDGLYSTFEPMPLCEGNGEVKELVSILLARSYDGYFSIAPYFGDRGIDDCKRTLEDFKMMLKRM